MTVGELAAFLKDSVAAKALLTVVPMRGWRRSEWFDETGMKWRPPSRDVPTLGAALLFGGLAPLQAANVSLGRGTPEAYQHVAASWLKGAEVARLLNDRLMPGVQFHDGRFSVPAIDGRGAERAVPGVRVEVLDRERASPSRIGAALLWAIVTTTPDSLRVDAIRFDALMGSPRVREALLRGDDPDDVLDRELAPAMRFRELVRRALLYR